MIGDEAFLQPTQTTQIAAFLFEELKLGSKVRLQFGARVEHQSIHIDNADPDAHFAYLSRPAGPGLPAGQRRRGRALRFRRGLAACGQRHLFPARADGRGTLRARPARRDFSIHYRQSKSQRGKERRRRREPAEDGRRSHRHHQRLLQSLRRLHRFRADRRLRGRACRFSFTRPKTAEFYGGEAKVDFHLLPLTLTRTENQEAKDAKSVRSVITTGRNLRAAEKSERSFSAPPG